MTTAQDSTEILSDACDHHSLKTAACRFCESLSNERLCDYSRKELTRVRSICYDKRGQKLPDYGPLSISRVIREEGN